MKFDFSFVHVAVVALANFILGWLWFSRLLFHDVWLRGLGKDPKVPPTKEDTKKIPFLMFGFFVSAFLLSIGMAVLDSSVGISDGMSGLALGAFSGITLIAAHSLGTAFEGRKMSVIFVSAGYGVVTLAMDGLVHGIWH